MYGDSKSLISRFASRLKSFFAGWERITGKKKYLTCAKSHKRFVWNDSVSVSRLLDCFPPFLGSE